MSMKLVSALVVLVWASPGWAQSAETKACLQSFDRAQVRRDAAELLSARRDLLICAQAPCPRPVAAQCVKWLDDIEQKIPSIVIAAKDESGQDATAGRVFVDGGAARVLDGKAVELNPGEHLVVVELPSGKRRDVVVVLRVGEKRRAVWLDFSPPPLPAPPPRGVAVVAIPGFAVGAVGIVVGIVTGVMALGDKKAIAEQCSQRGCSQEEIESAATVSHVSTASFVIGAVGMATGLVGLFLPGTTTKRGRLEPLLRPGFAGVRARF